MTKFKIISWILLLLILANFAGIAMDAYMIYRSGYDPSIPRFPVRPFYIGIAGMFVSSAGLYCLLRSCTVFLRRGYFNSKSATYLKRGSYILAAKALAWLVIGITNLDFSQDRQDLFHSFESISHNIFWIVISLALLGVADIIKKGENIKRENDLTI